jgi:YD repeat-containing protein
MVWIRVLCVLACLAFVPRAAEATITYVYDRLGRLTGVIDPAQGTVIFRFDAVGHGSTPGWRRG